MRILKWNIVVNGARRLSILEKNTAMEQWLWLIEPEITLTEPIEWNRKNKKMAISVLQKQQGNKSLKPNEQWTVPRGLTSILSNSSLHILPSDPGLQHDDDRRRDQPPGDGGGSWPRDQPRHCWGGSRLDLWEHFNDSTITNALLNCILYNIFQPSPTPVVASESFL